MKTKIVFALSLLVSVLWYKYCYTMHDETLFDIDWLFSEQDTSSALQEPEQQPQNSNSSSISLVTTTTESSDTVFFTDYLKKTLIPDFFKYTEQRSGGYLWSRKNYNSQRIREFLREYITTYYFTLMRDEVERFANRIQAYIENVHLRIAKK